MIDKLTTKLMEHAIYSELWQQGRYMCFEVKMPNPNGRMMQNDERVDLLTYETHDIWRFFELKLTKSDFHSTSKITFKGHYNYYVMPKELYSKVANEIPDWVGVYVVYESASGNKFKAYLIKRPKRQELQLNPTDLMFSLMQSLSRENQKYRKILENASYHKNPIIGGVAYTPSVKESNTEKFIHEYNNFDFCDHCANCSIDFSECEKCYRNSDELHDMFQLNK